MAQPLQNFQIAAPAFAGLNTEDSPVNQTTQYCQVADNAVIDSYGRVGARQAFNDDTATWPTLSGRAAIDGTAGVVSSTGIIDHVVSGGISGTTHILCLAREEGYNSAGSVLASDHYILKRVGTTLTELTLPTMTDSSTLKNGQIVAFNNKMYILSEGNEIVVYNGTTLVNISAEAGYHAIHALTDYRPDVTPSTTAQAPTPTIGLAAFGRLWVSGHNGDFERVWYSDINIGESWYDNTGSADALSTAGWIDVSQYWPAGKDRLVGLAAHNDFLIMFGRQSILVWGKPDGDPAAADGIFLSDTIRNIGLVSRDSIVNIGTDLLFVDDTGVRSLGRTITQQSAPVGDLTRNIRRDITRLIAGTTDNSTIKGTYVANQNFVLFYFPRNSEAFCLDLKSYLSEGTPKLTRWTGIVFNHACYVEDESTVELYLGSNNENGLLKYDGYSQYDGEPFVFKYRSNPLYFENPGILKFPKVMKWTSISSAANSTGQVKWGFNSLDTQYAISFSVTAETSAEFNIAEFNIDEFASSSQSLSNNRVNLKGSGETVVIGFDVNINGNSFSLQEINLQSLLGRLR